MESLMPAQLPIDELPPLLGLRDLTEILIKHYGYREGKFETALTFDIGVGPMVRPGAPTPCPTVFASVVGVQLRTLPKDADPNGPDVVDAAEVNPA